MTPAQRGRWIVASIQHLETVVEITMRYNPLRRYGRSAMAQSFALAIRDDQQAQRLVRRIRKLGFVPRWGAVYRMTRPSDTMRAMAIFRTGPHRGKSPADIDTADLVSLYKACDTGHRAVARQELVRRGVDLAQLVQRSENSEWFPQRFRGEPKYRG